MLFRWNASWKQVDMIVRDRTAAPPSLEPSDLGYNPLG